MRFTIGQLTHHTYYRRIVVAFAVIMAVVGSAVAQVPAPAGATTGLTMGISGTDVVEGDSGTTMAVFFVDAFDNDPPIMCDVSNPDSCSPTYVGVCVDFATVDGTALAGQDYVATSGTLSFPATTGGFDPFAGGGTIEIPIIGDAVIEGEESFSVMITYSAACQPRASIVTPEAFATIVDDDQPTLSISDARVTEGNSGSVPASVTVTLSPAAFETVTVTVATSNISAASGSDYASHFGQLVFAPGEVSKTVPVTVFGDTVNEPTETFAVNLSHAAGAKIGDGQGIVTITDDDPSTLRLLSIVCRKKDDTLGNDEPYLKLGGSIVWSNDDFKRDSPESLTNIPARLFTGSIALDLYEADAAPNDDDFLGRVTITEADAGRGTRTATFSQHGALYEVQYRVD